MPEGEGFARRVRLENLDAFAPLLGRLGPADANAEPEAEEPNRDQANPKDDSDPELAAAEHLFVGEPLEVEVRYRRPAGGAGAGRVRQPRPALLVPPEEGVVRGPLLWRKGPLPASDVQRQQGNPTGGVRLSQAGFRSPDGNTIDQTTYFRDQVFGNLDWQIGRQEPRREDAYPSFAVTLLGQDYGVHALMVSHKPTGEAGQGNYTTMLHWRDLADTVRELNLVGRTLSLYGPPPGSDGPYHLEIA